MTELDEAGPSLWGFPEAAGRVDVSGYRVEAADGEVGKVAEATLDPDASYLVVDTGPWIFGKRVLLPAGLIQRVDRDEERVYLARTKDEIAGAPEFDAGRYQEAEYRDAIGSYYGSGRAAANEESADE